ncbi:unnamed protein product, partial [Cylicostephanus goldi]
MQICFFHVSRISELLKKHGQAPIPEKTLIDVDPPVIIVGDIHGQFNDLINMFLLLGRPPEKRYLFLGIFGPLSICTSAINSTKLCQVVTYRLRNCSSRPSQKPQPRKRTRSPLQSQIASSDWCPNQLAHEHFSVAFSLQVTEAQISYFIHLETESNGKKLNVILGIAEAMVTSYRLSQSDAVQ